jgi:hypothetical protein
MLDNRDARRFGRISEKTRSVKLERALWVVTGPKELRPLP